MENIQRIGEYRILDVIGQGSFSHVCKVISKDGNVYAIKVIDKNNIKTEEDLIRLKREVNTLRNIRHPNIIRFYDFIQNSENYCIVMEYFSGSDLFDFIVAHSRLNDQCAASIFKQIVQAVQYIHSISIVHRDLKPHNIMVDKDERIKIIDFGFCAFADDDQKMNSFCGSPCYTPPEYIQKVSYDGKKSDIWSLGVILYEMLTGQHPWNINNSAVMYKQILTANYPLPDYLTPDAVDLIKGLLQISPENRLTTDKILMHPFILNHTVNISQPEAALNKGLPPLIRRSVSLDAAKFKSAEYDYEVTQEQSNALPIIRRVKISRVEKPKSMCLFSQSGTPIHY